jgi:hypothetical protein
MLTFTGASLGVGVGACVWVYLSFRGEGGGGGQVIEERISALPPRWRIAFRTINISRFDSKNMLEEKVEMILKSVTEFNGRSSGRF